MAREYNKVPNSPIDYDTSRSGQKKTGFEKFTADILSRIQTDLIQPTVANLANKFIDLVSSSVKSSIGRKLGNNDYSGYGYSRYGDWTNPGYYGNSNYNPNRFNAVDGYAHNQAYGGPANAYAQHTNEREPWKNVGFRRQIDGEVIIDAIKNEVYKNGYISVYKFGEYCKQKWDWGYDNYGWTNLDSLDIRYNIADTSGLPFEFKGVPEPVYLNMRGMV